MQPQRLLKSIALIGFKHVGKTTVGKSLANDLNVPFFDVDREIESLYENHSKKKYTCREIVEEKGEKFFRSLETNALTVVVDGKPSVISLGGGAPVYEDNHRMIKSCVVIHVTAPRDVVFERIQRGGRPAFFNPQKDLLASFNQLWDEREVIYEKIKNFTVENNGDVRDAVKKIIQLLELGKE